MNLAVGFSLLVYYFRCDRFVGGELIERAVDLRLVGLPEMRHSVGKRTVEVVAAHRLD